MSVLYQQGLSIVGWGSHFCRARETVTRFTDTEPAASAWLEL